MYANANAFPAVLIAGPPHSGKSVLSYLLSQHLRQARIAHYLLRAAPDGEGDWFLHNYQKAAVRIIRQANKSKFSKSFEHETLAAIRGRMVPLLVDIGGQPQGEQFAIMQACTHAVLLYKTSDEKETWNSRFSRYGLPIIAELHSVQNAPESIRTLTPTLCGDISGLRRQTPQTGVVFGALLERLRGILHYDEETLAFIHLQQAPYAPVQESGLARQLGLWTGEGLLRWQPEQTLPRLADWQPPSGGMALYGRGPVWLAAALAVRSSSAAFSIFDPRYGWLHLPPVRQTPASNLKWKTVHQKNFLILQARLPGGWIAPEDLWLPASLPPAQPIVLDGRLPRWAMAALTRALAPGRDWLAIRDLHDGGAVVVESHVASVPVGKRIRLDNITPEKNSI